MSDKPLQKPRQPTFNGTETIPWKSVGRTLDDFVRAYYKHTLPGYPKVKAREPWPTSFARCHEKMKKWISAHSILGNPEAESFEHALVLPVVNPDTGKLNAGGVRSANAYAGKVKGISDSTVKETKKLLTKLYEEHFAEGGTENITYEQLLAFLREDLTLAEELDLFDVQELTMTDFPESLIRELLVPTHQET